jgi:signal transduction histidine kinase/CheY-like chemotaxis protein/HPt (histidine-containing phosphotransfer) domain-containing protein
MPVRLRRPGIRAQLMALVVLLIGTGGSVLLIDESASRSHARHLQWMVDGPLATLASAGAMTEAYSQDLMASSCRALRGQMGARQAAALGESAMARVAVHWSALLQTPTDTAQQALLGQIAEARAVADRVASETLAALQADDPARLQPLCETELGAAIDPVILRLRLLSELAMAGADAKLAEDRALMQRARAWRIGLSLFTLAVVAAVGWRISRNLVRGIEGLEDLALRLRERDFRDVDVFRPSGELGAVVDAFEDMRRELLRYGTELRRSELRANAANRAKSAFLATMSHELRTPMIGVTGMVEVMSHTRLDEDQRRALAMIRHSADNLLQIIGDILDFSKIEAGKLELAPVPTDLRRLVEGCVLNFVAAASSKGLSLDCRLDPALAQAYLADPLRLRQILGNFLSNAIKFTEHGGVHVSLERISRSESADSLRLRVSDTGIGIPVEAQAQLFEPFAQAETSTTRRFGGSGLGLAICAHLAELMGARIGLESREGEGTRLSLELELSPTDPNLVEVEPAARAAALEARRRLPSVTEAEAEGSLVLLVDDHPTNRLVVTRQLALAGFRCETADDGERGLQAWRSRRFALVLTDIHMPAMDGYQLAAEIRAEESRECLPRTPLIALTAAVLKGEAERCIEAGMDDYIAKPASIDTLLKHLCHWLPHLTGTAAPAAAVSAAEPGAGADAPPDSPASFDPQPLRAVLGEDPGLLRQVLEEFFAAAGDDVEAAEAAWRRGDRAAIVRQAHRLQAAAALAGAEALRAQAAELERGATSMAADALELAVARLHLRLAEFSEATGALRLAPREPGG